MAGEPGKDGLNGRAGKYIPAPRAELNACQKCPPGPPDLFKFQNIK